MLPKIVLAPLSGVSDLAFRLVCRQLGARFCFFEMLDSSAMVHGQRRTMRIIKTLPKDRPVAAQILGSDPEMVLDAAQKLTSLVNISLLDLNGACPAPKVIRKRAGAYLLDDTRRLGRIIKKLAGGLSVPVTVKLRSSFDEPDTQRSVDTAKTCRDNGASLIFFHGRTRLQGYAGNVDYDVIKAVKEAVDIPVYGSGDILSPPLAKKMFDMTGCDGVLVARGAFGNPWIFRDIEYYLAKGVLPGNRRLWIKKRVLEKHLAYLEKYKTALPFNKISIMAKTSMWYLKSLPNARRIREDLGRIKSYAELKRFISRVSS